MTSTVRGSCCKLLRRWMSSKTKRLSKRSKREEVIQDYVGENTGMLERTYTWGNARTGALGVPRLLIPDKPHLKPVLTCWRPYEFSYPRLESVRVKHIAAGHGFSVCGGKKDKNSSYILGTGINTDSQLGYHSQGGVPVDFVIAPQQIELPNPEPGTIRDIACGRAHTVIVTDQAVYTLGNNAFGQCGRSIVPGEQYSASRLIYTLERDDIIKAVCGHDHTLLLTKEGKLLSFGLGSDGQTGVGTYDCIDSPTEILGELKDMKVTDMACRCDTVLALTDDGNVFGWGNSEYGQFEMVTNEPQVNLPIHLPLNADTGHVKAVASAGTKCAVLNDKGEVYVWGYGILGKGPMVQSSIQPQLLPPPLFGSTDYNKDVRVATIYSGVNYLAAITNQGALYTWGKNDHGAIGLDHKDDQFFPFEVSTGCEVLSVACGADHMIARCKTFS